MPGYHDDDLLERGTIPHLRYKVYFSNRVILPQEIAAFFNDKVAEDFINQTDLPAGTYVIKDAVTNKDILIKGLPD